MQKIMTTFRKTLLPLLLVAIVFALTSCGAESDVVDMLRQEGKLAEKSTVDIINLEETEGESRYITIENSGNWWHKVSLVTLSDKKIKDFRNLEELDGEILVYRECKINDKTYWQFDLSNHQGNGYTCFFDPTEEKVAYKIDGTVDKYREGYLYEETAKSFALDPKQISEKERYNYSRVIYEDRLSCSIKDRDSDGYDDLSFEGTEQLLDSDRNCIKSQQIKMVYVYQPDTDDFVLAEVSRTSIRSGEDAD